MNPNEHWFWWGVTAAVLIWYSTVTIYIAIRGAFDIREMLDRLKAGEGKEDQVQ